MKNTGRNYGDIIIGENAVLLKANLQGDIEIGKGAIINRSELSSEYYTIQVPENAVISRCQLPRP